MRFIRPLMLAAGLAVLAGGFGNSFARGQEAAEPVAIISISPLDRLLNDTSYLLRAANVPEMGGLVSLMGNQYTQGVDRTKPLGATVTLDGQLPSAIVFMPMKDRQQFFGALAGMGIEPDDLGGGLYEIDANGQTLYAKDAGEWMFVAQSEAALDSVPENPAALLGELPKQYNIAVRVNVQSLPPELKAMVSEQMKIGFERGMAEQGGQTDEEQEAARKIGEAQIAQIEQLMTETQQVVVGWNIDSAAQRVYIDAGAQFLEGSRLASQSAAMQDLTSDFTAFSIPGAAVHFRLSSEIVESDKEIAKQNLKNSMAQVERQLDETDDMPEEAKAMLKELLTGLSNITADTIDDGIFDGAGSISLSDSSLKVLMGGRVADGRALAAELKEAAATVPADSQAPKFEFDYESYKGIDLHRAIVPIEAADPNAKRIFGDQLTLTIGTGETSVMLALDSSGDASLKQAIDRMQASPGVQVSPFEAVVEIEQILRFAQAVTPNSMLDNALQTVQQYSGKDKIEITSRIIPRGGIYRLTVEEGVLRSAGAAAKGANAPNGGF